MMNLSRLFKSRWSALLWAAGVLFTAWQIAIDPPAGGDGPDVAANQEQGSTVANAL